MPGTYISPAETGFYYLNSRYYDPVVGRFLNADGYISTGQGLKGYNMFAYCGNDPTNNVDPCGNCYYDINGKWRHDNWEFLGGYERKPEPAKNIGKTETGQQVYISSTSNYSVPRNAVKVVDARNADNPNIRIIDSYKISDENLQREILKLIIEYDENNPSSPTWERTIDSMVLEWDIHNKVYNWNISTDSTAHVDLDNHDEGRGWFGFAWERVIKPKLPF